jgi:plasmid replication initiation protein
MTEIRNPLLPQRYSDDDLFVCDIVDASPKGDMGSMEHPLFSLSTKPDMKAREYRNGDKWLTIQPSTTGLATVHDRDVLIYCISQCMAALNNGEKVSRRLQISAYDLLRATNRQDSGAGNDRLKDALRRLAGTRVETNIQQGGETRTSNFGMIDSFHIVSKTSGGRIQQLEVTLSDWVFEAINNQHVLTLSKRYFQLRKPIERRLYELARKHCGKQARWEITLTRLKDKTGSSSTDKEFKRMLLQVISDNLSHHHMPDYSYEIVSDKMIVRPIKAAATDHHRQPFGLHPDTYDEARKYAAGWDIRVLEAEWRDWVNTKGIKVRNADSNFISFCKSRGPYKQEELF